MRLIGLQLQPAQFGHAVNEPRGLLAEQRADLLDCGACVLHGVVEQSGRDRRAVELELGQDAGDLDGMGEIGVAAGAGLRAVRLHREDVGAVQQSFVRCGLVALNALDEFVLPDHGRRYAPPAPAEALRRVRAAAPPRPVRRQPRYFSAFASASGGPDGLASPSCAPASSPVVVWAVTPAQAASAASTAMVSSSGSSISVSTSRPCSSS